LRTLYKIEKWGWKYHHLGVPTEEKMPDESYIPHLAFVVKDLDYELANRNFNLLGEPNSPSVGLRVAMIEYNGAPIELMEFGKNKE